MERFIVTADITKMYRQIRFYELVRVYQHLLWRRSPSDEVHEYQLCMDIYDVSSAPFIAIRCLRQLDQIEPNKEQVIKVLVVH